MSSTLILGGRRSGKSRRAQALAEAYSDVVYIATATAWDEEMVERIAHHQSDRPSSWKTVESPLLLAETLLEYDHSGRCLLVDCLTLWQTNLLLLDNPQLMRQEVKALQALLPKLSAEVLLVSNEVGWSIVPENALARQFADEVGRLHQQLAACCNRVELVVAGIPVTIKAEEK
ncbi:bifunctional adenosylcobinamide kinase/adenosylcobinamide-phosphate guanylyltransferase [Leeia sp. TBRC 13508]|uniref:Bifunctional adenosylcobalamin biosynthesis protein n=1 Tax=Leeia speluncae TaxID=2884804 RepID=A0ABS8D3F5_9NEIS|nr:bifunctional adenosylcobinamide kinase/adenosylcobinamide-phosphate guanylyltransferase [Leeia speluncae]MCB6182563.1 bifunctional adenosylcobinamide kinase/adenosylcobinamide-phosphate guanylyltransferase [Leeia speluncae]